SLTYVYLSGAIQGSTLKVENRMENLLRLSFLKINGRCDFSFLKMFPNLESLLIGDFAQIDDCTFSNIGESTITELALVRTQNITDKGLIILSSMPSLVKFSIKDRLHDVTQSGWLSFAKRIEGCPSWVELSIDDGRQINSKFFEILDREHPKLEALNVKGLNINLNSEEIMQTLKFRKSSEYYKDKTQLHWPIRYKLPSYVQRNVFKNDYYHAYTNS
ncbi:9063_t:CDS:1, partial [Acaulospora colombiana]